MYVSRLPCFILLYAANGKNFCMIDAKELRIGNLFSFHGIIAAVTSIDSKFVEGGKPLNAVAERLGRMTTELAEPIPLTPEILESAGFEYSIGTETKTVFYANGAIMLVENNGGYNYMFSKTALKYVHQLQNLYFALTGSELTINLNVKQEA